MTTTNQTRLAFVLLFAGFALLGLTLCDIYLDGQRDAREHKARMDAYFALPGDRI